jgi:hypothetical protein
VNSWFRDHYHILREHDVRTFPPHSPQELQALTIHEGGPPVVPEPAVVGTPDAPAVSWIDLPPDQLTFRNIRLEKAATGAQNNRSVMDRYIRHDKDRALWMMQYWEADRNRPERLFGLNRALPFVIDLSEFLQANNMMPQHPDNWIDPLGEDQYNAMKLWNLENHKRATVQLQVAAANCRLDRAREIIDRSQGYSGVASDTRSHANHPHGSPRPYCGARRATARLEDPEKQTEFKEANGKTVPCWTVAFDRRKVAWKVRP